VTYVAAADFRLGSLRPWTANIALGENDATDLYLDAVIAWVTTQVEADLSDDFEPPQSDADETLELEGSGRVRQYIPRRVRSLTTVKTRSSAGALTSIAATDWRLHKSLNANGTAMVDNSQVDYLDLVSGAVWPEGTQTVQLVGKFGWAAVPDDVRRLVSLRTYALVKATADPLSTVLQKTTIDAVTTFGPSTEETEITERYDRALKVTIG
jgi:hypothetical protein